MNKKFFGALLMGALAVASVSTITSCKDYDDDISGLQAQIDKLSEAVKKIEEQIANGAILTSVTPVENGIKITLNQNGVEESYTITNGKDGAAGAPGAPGKDGKSWEIKNGTWWYDEGDGLKDSGLSAVGKDGEDGKDGKDGAYYVPNGEGFFDKYQDGKKVETTNISYYAEGTITAVQKDGVLTLTGVKGAAGNKVVINLNSELKSLVFSPSLYVDGVEAIALPMYKYLPMSVEKVDANGDFSKDQPSYIEREEGYFYFAPEMCASYFLNPSNADVTEDAKDYKFLQTEGKYISTRASRSNIFAVKSVEKKDGKVEVHAKYSGAALKELMAGYDEMALIALQYNKNEVAVTSDFATVHTSNRSDVMILNAKSEYTDDKGSLWFSADKAIDSKYGAQDNVTPLVAVKYDNNKGIDLRECIRTAWNEDGKYITLEKTNATEKAVEKDGFKYTFELVGYHEGANKTSQSAHAAIAADGHTLRPQVVGEDGKQLPYGAAQNRSIIDREPLVRVVLNDTVNNRIAAVGYLKLQITESETDPTFITKEFTDNTAYTLDCSTGNALSKEVTWYEIENKILADKDINMSKADFEATYVLDGADKNDLDQFDKNTLKATPLAAGKKFGTVAVTTADVEGTMTEVLKWTMSSQKAYSLFKEGKKEITTYVRFTLKEGKTAAHKYIYVKFTWTPSAINLTPETSFSNDNKIKQAWYAQNSIEAGTGYYEIHGNVEQMGTPTSNDEFVFDMKNTLVNNKLVLAKMNKPYDVLNDVVAMNAHFSFVDGHNHFADATGMILYGDNTKSWEIARMTSDGVVTLQKNAKTLELLNAFGPAELANVLTARVAVTSATCWGAPIVVKNNEFDVKFIRPITVDGASAEFTDAVKTQSKLNLTFKNWNGYDFTDANRAFNDVDYFQYYKVTKIALDTDNAKTDINGKVENLKDVTKNIRLKYNAPSGAYIAAGEYGTLEYNNNGTTVGDFTITIPATVTYEWGTLKTEVKVTVKKSQVATAAKK